LLVHIWLFGQKTLGILKFDFDTTVIYADLGVVFEFSGNELQSAPTEQKNCPMNTSIQTD
jgi:hypothetical protein